MSPPKKHQPQHTFRPHASHSSNNPHANTTNPQTNPESFEKFPRTSPSSLTSTPITSKTQANPPLTQAHNPSDDPFSCPTHLQRPNPKPKSHKSSNKIPYQDQTDITTSANYSSSNHYSAPIPHISQTLVPELTLKPASLPTSLSSCSTQDTLQSSELKVPPSPSIDLNKNPSNPPPHRSSFILKQTCKSKNRGRPINLSSFNKILFKLQKNAKRKHRRKTKKRSTKSTVSDYDFYEEWEQDWFEQSCSIEDEASQTAMIGATLGFQTQNQENEITTILSANGNQTVPQ